MVNIVIERSAEAVKTVTKALSKLVQFKMMYVTVMVASMIYLVANNPTIGVSQEIVFIYGFLSLFGLVWADFQGINLDQLNWRASSPLGGKIIKTPQKNYTIILFAMVAAIATAALVILLQDISPDLTLDSAARLEIATQQLFIVTLTETVLFVGIVPLILMKILFNRKDVANATGSEWAVVYILSQAGFAIMHNFVFGGDIIAMIRVGSLGIIWLWLSRHYGMGAAWGSHFGWNCAVLGLIVFGGI